MGENMTTFVSLSLADSSQREATLAMGEILHLLLGSAIWLLVQARVRPHQMKERPLANALPSA